jgi:hypothetical protein
MKKILALAFVLAIVAILAVPMAASAATGTGGTTVGGSVRSGTITVAPPSAINFVLLNASPAVPEDGQSVTPGRVTVVPGTSGKTAWTMTAKSTTPAASAGYLATPSSVKLDQPLLIAKSNAVGTLWNLAAGGSAVGNQIPSGTIAVPHPYFAANHTDLVAGVDELDYDGADSVTNIFLYAKQWVNMSDATAGTYSCTITFTATITGEI